MKSNTTNKKRVNDKAMLIIAVGTIAILFLMWRMVAKPIINKTAYDRYINDLTITLNNANEEYQPVIAVMDGKEYKLDQYSKGTYYAYIIDIGMGMPIEGEAGEEVFTIKYPDGTTLEFREGEITRGARAGRKGAYIYYKGASGREYNYASDTATFRALKDVLQQQIFWEEYEEKQRKEALEERAKEIEANLNIERDDEESTEEVSHEEGDDNG